MSTPPSPSLPKPNEEVGELPVGELPPQTFQDIDLNPGLDDKDDTSSDGFDMQVSEVRGTNEASSNEITPQEMNVTSNGGTALNDIVHSDGSAIRSDFSTGVGQESSVPRSLAGEPISLVSDTSSSDSEDIELRHELVGPSFEEEYTRTRQDLEGKSRDALDGQQQSKFVNYVDEQLLKIQRRFVKNQADTRESYSLDGLLHDLSLVVDVIWYSIFPNNSLFGQGDYLIKIMGDLEEYLSYYKIYDVSGNAPASLFDSLLRSLVLLFRFLQSVDVKLSILANGYKRVPGERIESLSPTQMVRLRAIVSRVRIIVVTKMEKLNSTLNNVLASESDRSQRETERRSVVTTLRALLELELSKLFEGLMER